MQRVFVLDCHKNPLMPCTPARARRLLRQKKAAVYKYFPFTIVLKHRVGGNTQPIQAKFDQGSKITGLALVADFKKGKTVIFAANIEHKGQAIVEKLLKRAAIRRSRRNRKTRYRKPKWTNAMSQAQLQHINQRPKGWLPPSARSRLDNIRNMAKKLLSFTPITSFGVENVRFDTQLMVNPTISGIDYQQGTLFEYEVKEYLLHLYHYRCAYCHGLSNDPILEKEHIIPKSKHGTNRIDNLALACRTCNKDKDNYLPHEWLNKLSQSKTKINQVRLENFTKISQGIKPSMRDAAVMNSLRYKVVDTLQLFNLPIELGSGGLTKYNRTLQQFPKDHWIDAACVGQSGVSIIIPTTLIPINIKALGRGSRQMCRVDRFGFPRTKAKTKSAVQGFKTGDLVKAIVLKGKKQGTYQGRIAVRENGYFNITTKHGIIQGISYNTCRLLQRNDGYQYSNHKTVKQLGETR